MTPQRISFSPEAFASAEAGRLGPGPRPPTAKVLATSEASKRPIFLKLLGFIKLSDRRPQSSSDQLGRALSLKLGHSHLEQHLGAQLNLINCP